MSEYKLCVALGQLPENMIAAAMDAGADSRRRRRFQALTVLRRVTSGVVAAAIVLAMFFGFPAPGGDQIVTAPGVLVVTAYGDGLDPEGVVLEEGVVLLSETPATVLGTGDLFYRLWLPEMYGEDISFRVIRGGGMFAPDLENDIHPTDVELTLENGELFGWNPDHNQVADLDEGAFLRIIIYDGFEIIGYSLLQGCPHEWGGLFTSAVLVESVYYPLHNGIKQVISEEYVEQQIQAAIQRIRAESVEGGND
jgi:hypothetical protein